jgi:FAD/FMN-containing dehydrogenase
MPQNTNEGLSRRDALRLLALGAAAAVAGCSNGPPSSHPSSPSASRSTLTSTTSRPPAPDWAAFSRRLRGDVVRRGDAGYQTDSHLFNNRFDDIRPLGVAYCADAADVATAVAFARDSDLPLALRAGGHSYGGWSTGKGLVLDVSRIKAVRVDGTSATVGAGARLIDAYAGVARRGMALPAGSCPTVGVTGLTLGGGLGVMTRAWGLTCDNLVGLKVVTADGQILDVDADREPDLFWACRGGGGGNLGVVTELRFRLRPAPRMTTWYVRWEWDRAADVLAGWQSWAADSPRSMWSTCKLLTRPGQSTAVAQIGGTWMGDPTGLDSHLGDIRDSVGHAPAGSSRRTRDYLDTMLVEAGCDPTADTCTTPRTAFSAASHVLTSALPPAAVTTAVDHIMRRQVERHPKQDGVSFDVLGGAVNDLAPGATAFPHRRALAVAQYTVSWPADQSPAKVRADIAWLHQFRDAMTPYVGNTAYVNYADPQLRDWQQAYYGANYVRLQTVKQRYDPDELFTFPQAVIPS